jgi:hypothetical protein
MKQKKEPKPYKPTRVWINSMKQKKEPKPYKPTRVRFKPTKPYEPQKEITVEVNHSLNEKMTLVEICYLFKDVDPNIVTIRQQGCYDSAWLSIGYTKLVPNANYEHEYKVYLKNLEVYKAEMVKYIEQESKLLEDLKADL